MIEPQREQSRPRPLAGLGIPRGTIEIPLPRLHLPTAKGLTDGGRRLFGNDVSIRWRLTLWFSAILAVLLGAFSLVVYWYMGSSLTREMHELSVERALQVQDLVREQETQALILRSDPIRREIRGRLHTILQVNESVNPFQNRGVGVRVYDWRGSPIGSSSAFNDDPEQLPINRVAVLAALQYSEHSEVLQTVDGAFYTYTRPALAEDGRLLGAIQILTSRGQYEMTMDRLARMLVFGTLLGTVLALAMGAAMAQTALAPIDAITRTAQKINQARDLSRRIPLRGPRDEVGRLGATFNEMLDRIEALFERQRQFLADVSHELRTPLTTIRGELDLMERTGLLDPEGLEAMSDESERMARLVNDLLLLARADSGLDVERLPVALDDLVVDVARQARTLAGGKRDIEVEAVAQVSVDGDRDRLKQLLLILVDNALKHTPEGTTVRLGVSRSGRGAAALAQLCVSDDGPGVPADDRERIFDRFYRGDKARSRSNGSTGLGLAIARWIVTAHGGDITLDDRTARGTRFVITLPPGSDQGRTANERRTTN